MEPGIYKYRGFEICSDKHPKLYGNWIIYSPVGAYVGRAKTLSEARELIREQMDAGTYRKKL